MNSEYYLYDRHTCKLRLSIVWTIHQSKAEIEFLIESWTNTNQIQIQIHFSVRARLKSNLNPGQIKIPVHKLFLCSRIDHGWSRSLVYKHIGKHRSLFGRRILPYNVSEGQNLSWEWKYIWKMTFVSLAYVCMMCCAGKIQGVLFPGTPPKSSKYKKLIQATLGVSRPIYVNVDSPNLGFPYFNFLGG